MRKFSALLAAAALASGAWLFTTRYQIQGWDKLRLTPQGVLPADVSSPVVPAVPNFADSVRIASFYVRALDESKIAEPGARARLVEILRRFDVTAVQGSRLQSDEPLARLVEAINAAGGEFEYVIGPPPRPMQNAERFAFVFNAATVEVDRTELYVVNDPDHLLRCDPLVAWFRMRGPRPEKAFTFTLVNVQVDPENIEAELDVLADVFARVRRDGRGEDDVILVGDFQADERRFSRLGDLPHVVWAISGRPTTTRGDASSGNLVFDAHATREFAGRVGVLDFLRELNLSLEQALEISDHLPVWAEFSVYEGSR